MSGQAINFQKSGIFFSANMHTDKQDEIKNLLGVQNDLSEGQYMGLPSLIGRWRKAIFNFLKEQMWKRIRVGVLKVYRVQVKPFYWKL